MFAALFDQYRFAIGVALFALLALWKFWPVIQPRLTALWTRAVPGGAPAMAFDDDTLDFQALKRLQDRFDRQKCKEGQAAVDTCLAHFFHGEGGPGA